MASTALTAALLLATINSSRDPADALLTFAVISPVAWLMCWCLAGVLRGVGDSLVRGSTPDVRIGRGWTSSSTAGADLREDPGGRIFADRGGVLLRRRVWFVASGAPPTEIDRRRWSRIAAAQRVHPQYLARFRERTFWWYEDAIYWTVASYGSADVKALLHARRSRHERKLEHARALMAASTSQAARKREHIPREVRLAVWERDRGRCVQCANGFDIQYDHVIPFSMGGSSTVDNLQLLCARCNQSKGARL
jgi:5-methylcytosine-specific restriction endonuclease McrA